MNRISDIAMQQLLLQGFQRAQSSAQTHQLQLASGDKFQTYSGYGADALRLISAEGVVARASAYENAGQVALTRLQTQETAMTTIADSVADVRQDFVQVLATGSPELLMPELEVAAQRILGALNIQTGGVYLFGGVDGTVPPVAADTLADLGAAASIDGLFTEGDRATLAVEEGVTVDGGPRASDVARDLLIELQDLATVESRLGPFQGQLTAAQRDYLVNMADRFGQLAADLNQELGLNGVAQFQAAEAVERNIQRRDFSEIVAADIENVDIAEALARLNQDQLAIQASARALGEASQLSLLNFI